MNLKTIFFASLFLLLIPSPQILAQTGDSLDSQKEATQTADTENNIDPIKKEVEEKVAEKIQEITSKKRGYFGKIADVFNHTLVLTVKNSEKTIKVNETADIVGRNRQQVDFEDLEIGSYLIVMGYEDSEGILDGRRLVETSEPTTKTVREVIYGTISQVDLENNSFEIIKVDTNSLSVSLTKTTKITQGKNQEKTDRDALEVGKRIIIIGASTEENEINAQRIHLLSSENLQPTASPEN